jgi:polygalacturonase
MKKILPVLLLFSLAAFARAETATRVSQWGFNAENATKCLQDAIDSGTKKLLVDNTGSDWIVNQIELRSDLELIFADGVVVRALPGAFKNQGDCLFRAMDCRNITLRGEGHAQLIMNKEDYRNPELYKWSEWRHLLSFRGCENVTVKNLTLKSSGGDGIYISTGTQMPGCRNVVIDSVTSLDHYRQGISVISAENLLVKNCKFNNTQGTPPAAGIDFEPNKANEWVINCVVEDSEFNNNAGAGILLHLTPLTAASKPVSVTIRNCVMAGNGNGFILTASHTTPVTGSVTLENSRMSDSRSSDFVLNDQQGNGLSVTVRDCVIDNRKSGSNAVVISSKQISDVGGLTFDNLQVIPNNRPPFSFLGLSGAGLKDVQGTAFLQDTGGNKTPYNLAGFIAANKPNEELKRFAVEKINLKALKPIGPDSKNGLPNARFRGRFKLLQYAEAGKPLEMKFKTGQVGSSSRNIDVQIKDSNGTPFDKFKITGDEYTYTLKPNVNDVFTFEIDTGAHTLSLNSGAPGQAILADARTGMFGGAKHKFYFMVPAGVKDISIEVAPEVNEPVSSALLDPSGKAVLSYERSADIRHLKYSRPDASKAEIWCLSFPWAREDFRFRVGSPLLPLVSTAPENLLVAK